MRHVFGLLFRRRNIDERLGTQQAVFSRMITAGRCMYSLGLDQNTFARTRERGNRTTVNERLAILVSKGILDRK
jgi:hypothetical protein